MAPKVPAIERVLLTRIGDELGVDYDTAGFAAPYSLEQRMFCVIQGCFYMLTPTLYRNEWKELNGSKGDKKRAVRVARKSLPGTDGQAALCWSAAGFGDAMAILWEKSGLNDAAESSRALSASIREVFPVVGYDQWLAEVNKSDSYFERLKPDLASSDTELLEAPFDWDANRARVRLNAQSLAILLLPSEPGLLPLVLAQLDSLSLGSLFTSSLLQSNWAFVGKFWDNATLAEPVSQNQLRISMS